MKKIKKHFGIYGVILNNSKILLIKKSRGPYKGKLDLPGGRPEQGETEEQTLKREVLEETGVIASKAKLLTDISVTLDYELDNEIISFHHTGLIYLIESYDDAKLQQDLDLEDSLGAEWHDIKSLEEKSVSPFVWIIKILVGKKIVNMC